MPSRNKLSGDFVADRALERTHEALGRERAQVTSGSDHLSKLGSLRAAPSHPSGGADIAPAAIRRIVRVVDGYLSGRQGVQTFSSDEKCIIRYAKTHATRGVRLSDGAMIRPGDAIIDLHCWNERVPPMPETGPDLAWAHHASGQLKYSLGLLARATTTLPDLRDAQACRARVIFVGQGGSNKSLSRIIRRLGFEDVDEESATTMTRVHNALENILIGALVWTHNPNAFRLDKIVRERRPVWTSRARLLRTHGVIEGCSALSPARSAAPNV